MLFAGLRVTEVSRLYSAMFININMYTTNAEFRKVFEYSSVCFIPWIQIFVEETCKLFKQSDNILFECALIR